MPLNLERFHFFLYCFVTFPQRQGRGNFKRKNHGSVDNRSREITWQTLYMSFNEEGHRWLHLVLSYLYHKTLSIFKGQNEYKQCFRDRLCWCCFKHRFLKPLLKKKNNYSSITLLCKGHPLINLFTIKPWWGRKQTTVIPTAEATSSYSCQFKMHRLVFIHLFICLLVFCATHLA